MLGLALLAGILHAQSWSVARQRDCRLHLRDGATLAVHGSVTSAPVRGRTRVALEEGAGPSCRAEVTVLLPRDQAGVARGAAATGAATGAATAPATGAATAPATGAATAPAAWVTVSDSALAPGRSVAVTGRWRRNPGATDPERAGELVADEVTLSVSRQGEGGWARRRAAVEGRLRALYPERHGLVSALILARKEGLDPSLREAFARAGTAHLLAISGFHVGVVAALLLGALRGAGLARRPAGVVAALAVWLYVLFIGAPDAAARAALVLTLFAAGALRGRPLSGIGALASAFLALLLVDAGALARPGFQLSFAGAAGLVLWARGLETGLRRLAPAKAARPLLSAVAAGVAATLATLPVVAWHFDQVSVVGIVATLASTPLVAAAIPGSFASLAADLLHPALGRFLAGGVDLLLVVLQGLTRWLAALPFAVLHVPRSWILAGSVGALAGWVALQGASRLGRPVRSAVLAAVAAASVLLLPLWERAAAGGGVEIHVLDVGQGDAVLLRSPRSRWVLVDAGPPPPPGRTVEPRVLSHLRERGVRRLEALVLTHPHLDHIGGAGAVLAALPVALVLDPGLASGSASFVGVLEAAQRAGSGWRAARLGDRLEVDGLTIEVLHEVDASRGAPDDANESSVVVLARFGAFEALLTGDAPFGVEEEAVTRSGPFEVLKVGHHGSRTSTSQRFLERAGARAAVISLGRGNRYGHPHREVLERLGEGGVAVYRTDRDGSVRVTARADGTFLVEPERRRPPAPAPRAAGPRN